MLILPNNYTPFNIMAVDPGLNNTGISIYTLNCNDRSIIAIDAFTLKNDKLNDNSGLDSDVHLDRIIKSYKLKNHLINVLHYVKPLIVICESPFYNHFRPSAYASLLQIIQFIQTTVIEYNPNVIFHTLEPLLIKKIIGAGMVTGKIDVKKAVTSRGDIMDKLICNIELLDEHSIDAIAIGYSFLKLSES